MRKIKKTDHNYQVILIAIIIIIALIIATFIVMGNVKKPTDENIAVVTTIGELAINYVDGNEITLNNKEEKEYNISLTNTSNQIIYYSVAVENENQNTFASAIIKDENDNKIAELDKITDNDELITLNTLEPNETIRYKVIIKNNNKETYKGQIKVVNESMTTQTFADLILLNNNVNEPKTKIGSEPATSNEGLLSTKDNIGTTYFFRGNVNNNYVKIGDILFRIVRINGDGSVRLVLENTLENNYPYNLNPPISSNIGDMANLLNTSLINELNNWYEQNLSNYKNILVNGTFCTDITFDTQLGDIAYSDTYNKIYGINNLSLVCEGTTYNSYIGLLTANEIVFAGAYKTSENKDYYLYNEKITNSYLTLSTYSLNSSNLITMMNVNQNGSLGTGVLQDSYQSIRPVINISTNAKVKGKGTSNNPYIIVG